MSHFALRGCLIAGVLFFACESQSQEKPAATQAETQKEAEPQRAPEPLPVVITFNPVPQKPPCDDACKRAEKEKEQHEAADLAAQEDQAKAAWKAVYFTCAQFVLSGITLAFLYLTFNRTNLTAQAAVRAAEAAEASVAVAHKTAKRQLRAYVAVEEIKILPPNMHELFWKMHIVWQNSGTTPAKDAIAHTNWADFAGEMPDNFDFPDTDTDKMGGPMLLGPNQHLVGGYARIPRSIIAQVYAGKRSVYVYGWVEYDDIFPNTGRRRTECCYKLVFDAPEYLGGKGMLVTRVHKRFNSADENSYRKPTPIAPPAA